jgi:hypothetical protein
MEAGFGVIFRIPTDVITDGFSNRTWRLHVPTFRTPDETSFLLNNHNLFTSLCCDPEALSLLSIPDAATSSRSEMDQRKFELMCTRQKQAQILNESGGHRHDTFRDLEAAGVPVHHPIDIFWHTSANGVSLILGGSRITAKRLVSQGETWKYRHRSVKSKDHADRDVGKDLPGHFGTRSSSQLGKLQRQYKDLHNYRVFHTHKTFNQLASKLEFILDW